MAETVVAPEAPPVVPLLGVVAPPTPLVMPKKKPRKKEKDDGTE